MAWTRSLRADLKRYSTPALLLLAVLTSVGLALLTSACFHVAQNGRHLAEFLVLAVIVGVVSGRHALSLKGTHTGSSTADWLVFLGVVALGPYVGAILAAVDMLLSSRRVKAKPALYFFNVSNNAISVFAAGTVLKLASGYFSSATTVKTAGHSILVFAIPLICLALTHYVLHTLGLAAMAYLTFGAGLRKTVWNKLPWDPMSYVATATTAGLVDFVANHYSLITAAVTLVLALPVPVLIYYTFKTYRDKLDEQDRHFHELTDINDSILEMLAMAIDAKDQTTHDHIQRVRLFARRMGEIVGLSHPEIEALKAGALLHDIGKIGVPAYILNKPGRLTEHEFEQMKMHTIIGADMLSNVNFRYPVVPIVRHHHERWDGKGYPDGLAGESIPITARILTLVDNYDALRSDRPYHKAMTPEETLDYIKQNAGRFFDPSLVETFLSIVDDLEAQAAGFTSPETRKVQSAQSVALKAATPAAGFDSSPKTNRAAAALHSIAETNQRVTALYDLARNLAGAFSLEDTTAILTNRLAKLIPFTTCAVYLFDSGRSEFEVVHAIGRDAGKFFKQRLPVSSGITGWVIQNRRPMYNTNAVLDLGFLDQDAAAEYKGIMVYPLVKNQEALGAIALYSVELDSYPSESVQIMESISQPLSDSIYNAMAFEQAQRAALTDPVTGLANMRAFTAHFEREVVRSRRSGTALSL
ncbi:MAG TPA: HD domain-containing phosphohydrolase, partial [Blastocatellia bacterium]|nr:HD domain-containing phosphohydrolase [Blastocatellia bacterium]